MRPVDVKSVLFINFDVENNNKDPKLEAGDLVIMSKYKVIFAEGYFSSWSEEVFVNKKVKNTVPWTYAIEDLKDKEIIGMFYKNELQKTNQTEFRIEKVRKM